MKYNDLSISSHKTTNRVGRGIAAGQGKTAGRGTKGQNARTGSRKHPGFEGGSNPLLQRLPKLPGFTSHRTKQTEVFTGQIEKLKDANIDNATLVKNHLIDDQHSAVKLILKGDVTKVKNVKLQGASANAILALQAVGGSFTKVERVRKEKISKK